MKTKEERAKEIMDHIHFVLLNDWDPLGLNGIAPNDEYDAYIGGVYRLLTQHPRPADVARYLLNVECHDMGQTNRQDNLLSVAKKLLSIDISITDK